MAFGNSLGKPITDYSVTVSKSNIESQLAAVLKKFFANYGGADAYGRSSKPFTTYMYPAAIAPKVLFDNQIQGEIVGAFGEFVRIPNSRDASTPHWLKNSQVTQLTQAKVNTEVARVISAVVASYLKGVDLVVLSQNVPAAAKALVASAKNNINKDSWFKGWGLTVK